MSFVDVLQDCQRNNIKLTVRQGKLLADDPDGKLTPELRARLAGHKAEIIAWLEEASTSKGLSAQPARQLLRARRTLAARGQAAEPVAGKL